MLWSLISSAYIIYLYRKLRAGRRPPSPQTDRNRAPDVTAELDRLERRIDSIEARLGVMRGGEAAR